MSIRILRSSTASLALALIAACDKAPALPKRSTASKSTGTPGTKIVDTAKGSIELSLGSTYVVGPMSAFGSVKGTIRIPDSAAFRDTAAAKIPGCAPRGRGPARAPANKQFGNTVVWIADAKRGKPLPIDKRAEVASDNCLLDPRVQAVVVGTTVNVVNDDKVLHKLIFTKVGTRDTLTVMPFFNSGQVVASERLAKTPGMVEVTCVQHPWEHAYLAVFDHPYFAVTEDDGSFKIDSLAPGSYKLMIWHEGLAKPIEQQVQVAAGGTATISR